MCDSIYGRAFAFEDVVIYWQIRYIYPILDEF
jgi:hypothetical protein